MLQKVPAFLQKNAVAQLLLVLNSRVLKNTRLFRVVKGEFNATLRAMLIHAVKQARAGARSKQTLFWGVIRDFQALETLHCPTSGKVHKQLQRHSTINNDDSSKHRYCLVLYLLHPHS